MVQGADGHVAGGRARSVQEPRSCVSQAQSNTPHDPTRWGGRRQEGGARAKGGAAALGTGDSETMSTARGRGPDGTLTDLRPQRRNASVRSGKGVRGTSGVQWQVSAITLNWLAPTLNCAETPAWKGPTRQPSASSLGVRQEKAPSSSHAAPALSTDQPSSGPAGDDPAIYPHRARPVQPVQFDRPRRQAAARHAPRQVRV